MQSSYQQAIDYLHGLTDYEKISGFVYDPERFDLGRVERLMDLLGSPHRAFKSLHVAGTKGKGSTSAMLASVLRQAGYRTGLYTSPHLHEFGERIRLDGEMIAAQDVVAGVERLRKVVPMVPGITTFELITALAFDYFAGRAEWVVVEVGMGGRLDATNVVRPAVSIITSISYDHMAYLGDTLAAIAAEKAGIIKPMVPVVSAPQPTEAQETIEQIAAQHDAPLTLVGRDWLWESLHTSVEGQRFSAWPAADPSARRVYEIPLLGRHQQINATVALATVHLLRAMGVHISAAAISDGLRTVRWPARIEVVARRPWVIVDGAHNGDSMQKLRATIEELFPYNKMVLIFGASADKDLDRMLDAILPIADHILLSRAHHPRAADPESLLAHVEARGRKARIVPVERALEEARALAGPDDLICATGSLFLAADVRASSHNQ